MSKTDKPSNSSIKILLRSWAYAKPFTRFFVLVIVLNMAFSFLGGLSIAVFKPIIEVITTGKITATLTPNAAPLESVKNWFFFVIQQMVHNPNDLVSTLINLSLLIICIFLLKNIFKYFSSIAAVYLEENIIKSIRDQLFSKLTSLSISYFTRARTGSIISILTNDVNVVNGTTITVISHIVRDITQVLIYLLLLLAISPYLTLIAFSTSFISFLILRYGVKYLRKYAGRMQTAMADFTTVLQETISGIRVVKAYNAEEQTNKAFSSQTSHYVRSAVKYQRIIAMVPSINEMFAILSLCFVFYVGGSQVLNKTMRGDDLMLFLASLFSVMTPIATIFSNITQFQRGIVAAERLFAIMDQQPTVETGSKTISKFIDKLELHDVSFAYNEEHVVRNASLVINKGKKVALVGASGSGKSTVLDLIVRFYDPVTGKITIDNIDTRELQIESYRSMFGIVSQETMLFNDTIANNIRYGYSQASDEEIIEASKVANAYSFISKLPSGFNTFVGDRGVMLSGGERQRIAIARALIRNPYIIIFDEATSALDAESERIVQEAITDSLRDRTAVIVAHRLATIIDCDEIIVFDGGRIIERGSHKELFDMNGIYRRLYDIQFSTRE